MIVYRIVENDPAVEWDVLSHAERGIKPRGANPEMLARCAMQWEASLVAAERLEVRTKQAAYELSYQLLEGGPGLFADRERWLRQEIAALPVGTALPAALGRDLFAWKNATYMAQRRVSWDLPSAWRDVDEGSGKNE